jgi:flagellar hook-associated protein 2
MIGTLSFNSAQLTQALQTNPQQVYEMFANNPTGLNGTPSIGTGIVENLDKTLYQYTQFNGIIDQYASNQGYLGSQMINLNSQIYQMAQTLKQQQLLYISQYTAMEEAIGGLSGQSSMISSAFSSTSSSI